MCVSVIGSASSSLCVNVLVIRSLLDFRVGVSVLVYVRPCVCASVRLCVGVYGRQSTTIQFLLAPRAPRFRVFTRPQGAGKKKKLFRFAAPQEVNMLL